MTEALEPVVIAELTAVLSKLIARHDVLPFLTGMHVASEMVFRPLPDDMLALIVGSGDYQPVMAGADPTWLSVFGPDGHAEMIVYRAKRDEEFYVVTPGTRD